MISTTCKDCAFKIMHGNVQTGCELGILDRFEDSGATITRFHDDGKTYKQVNKVCVYRRPEWDWTGDIYAETFIRSTIVVIHNEGDDLESTLKSIVSLKTPKPPNVIICHTTNNPSEIHKTGISFVEPKRFSCVYMVSSSYNGSIYDEAFKRCKNGWIFFVPSGQSLDSNTLAAMNHAVNYNMKTHVATTGLESYMAIAYKLFHGHLGHIREALAEIPNATLDWKEIDENYRLYIS